MNYKGAIAIDLGTTNCVVTHITEEGKVEIIPNKDGDIITPSFIFLKRDKSEDGKVKLTYSVGKKAKEQILDNPKNVLSSYKPHMGKNTIIKDLLDEENIKLTAIQCSSLMLRYLKESAEKYLGENIKDVVITVPAYFSEDQKSATADAAIGAGLNPITLLPEPSAAALYYSERKKGEEKVVLVYDLGGGTFDVSLVLLSDEGNNVLNVQGDRYLGGDDLDILLASYILKDKFETLNAEDKEKAIKLAEKTKIELCEKYKSDKTIDTKKIKAKFQASLLGKKYKDVTVTYKEFIDTILPIMQKTLKILEQVLTEQALTPDDIDEVVLVGGSTKIPYISEMLKELGSWHVIDDKVDPDLAVAMGAGLQLKAMKEDIEVMVNVTPMPIGVELDTGEMDIVIPSSKQIPALGVKDYIKIEGRNILDINIFEGYDKIAKNNSLLGTLHMEFKDNENFAFKLNIRVNKDGRLSCKIIGTNGLVKKVPITRKYFTTVEQIKDLNEQIENDQNIDMVDDEITDEKIKNKDYNKTPKGKITTGWD